VDLLARIGQDVRVMREQLSSLKILVVILLIPIVPFLVFGGPWEAWVDSWKTSPPSTPLTAALIVGLLAADIFLPVPSSVLNTLAGSQLGVVGGTAASCLGMTIGAVVAFALAKRWGRPVALWFTREEDLRRLEQLAAVYGPAILVLFRALPVMAEASVLLVGLHNLAWRRFLPPVLLSNLGIGLAYAMFGELAGRNQWLPLALGIAVALPLLLIAVSRWWFSASEKRRPTDDPAVGKINRLENGQ
jgi:uncharacterized membrane protein YdjX (TVP38/TMEM64 family)